MLSKPHLSRQNSVMQRFLLEWMWYLWGVQYGTRSMWVEPSQSVFRPTSTRFHAKKWMFDPERYVELTFDGGFVGLLAISRYKLKLDHMQHALNSLSRHGPIKTTSYSNTRSNLSTSNPKVDVGPALSWKRGTIGHFHFWIYKTMIELFRST